MERLAECRVFLECPHCQHPQGVSVNALVTSGTVPREVHTCSDCGKTFWTQATLDVDIQPAS